MSTLKIWFKEPSHCNFFSIWNQSKIKIPSRTLQIWFENFIHELEKYVTGHWEDSGSKQVWLSIADLRITVSPLPFLPVYD